MCYDSGDDLRELTETLWPEHYIPEAGLGDLTGKTAANP